MLDERTRQMLEVANTLTAEDLDLIRSSVPAEQLGEPESTRAESPAVPTPPDEPAPSKPARRAKATAQAGVPRGERERRRTRESKVSTSCVGEERPKHKWWPVGTEIVGHIGTETFTAQVIENPQVKSGRSLLITSGPAQGRVCITPTRAAIEATEDYRRSRNLGRSGGVTNGWTFWQTQPS